MTTKKTTDGEFQPLKERSQKHTPNSRGEKKHK